MFVGLFQSVPQDYQLALIGAMVSIDLIYIIEGLALGPCWWVLLR